MSTDRCDLLCLDLDVAEQLRRERPDDERLRVLSDRARGLSDPTRLGIAMALSQERELCVCDLAWIVERSEGLVSHHLRALRTVAIVASRRDGKMVMYRLTDDGRALLEALRRTAGVTP